MHFCPKWHVGIDIVGEKSDVSLAKELLGRLEMILEHVEFAWGQASSEHRDCGSKTSHRNNDDEEQPIDFVGRSVRC